MNKLELHLFRIHCNLSDYKILIKKLANDSPNFGPDSLLAADVGEVH